MLFGTIYILCKHIFRLFGPPSPRTYGSMFYVLKISKNCHILTPLLPASAYVNMNGPLGVGTDLHSLKPVSCNLFGEIYILRI